MDLYEKYVSQSRKIADIRYATGLLYWDLEVNIPPKSHGIRSQQLATMSAILHETEIAPATGDMLRELAENKNLSDEQKRNVHESLYAYEKKIKYPVDWVQALNLAQSKGFIAWQESKKENEFRLFRNELEELIKFKREEAEILGYEKHPIASWYHTSGRGKSYRVILFH